MSSLKATDKKILEKLLKMDGGCVLSFSDRMFGQFFKDECGLDIYDEKKGYDYLGTSKANRMRAVWEKEDDRTVGSIIVTLIEYAKTDLLTDGKEITATEKELIDKAGVIGMNLLLSEFPANFRPEVKALKNKAQIIKDFNAFDFQSKTTNEKIYILKVMYSYYQGILEAYYGSGLFFLTSGIDDLNDYFKVLRKRIIEIVASDQTFSEIKTAKAYEGIVETITSLYSATDFFDGVWEDFTLPHIINLREEIADKELFVNNSEIHALTIGVFAFFQAVEKEIDTLKKYLDQKTKIFNEQELPKYKQQLDGAFKSDNEQTVKHEHKHFFENSIQEKDVAFNHTFFEGDTDGTVLKNKKKIIFPKFPATPYEQISIRFLTEQDVLITTPKKQLSSNYEALGFSNDKEKKPNTAWVLLYLLAMNGGEIKPPKPISDTLRQQKRQLADQLKLIFKNSQDPFEDYSETSSYCIKIKLEVVGKDEAPDPIGTQEYLNETMTEEGENYDRDFTQF